MNKIKEFLGRLSEPKEFTYGDGIAIYFGLAYIFFNASFK